MKNYQYTMIKAIKKNEFKIVHTELQNVSIYFGEEITTKRILTTINTARKIGTIKNDIRLFHKTTVQPIIWKGEYWEYIHD